MNILGRELRVIDITPFREEKSYRIEVYQRGQKEYCDKLNSHGEEQCDSSCKGLFLATEAYEGGGDSVCFNTDATMMVIPSHGFVDKGIFMAGFGLPDFERFEDFLRGWQKSSYLQRVLRLETDHVGGVTVYKANGRKCGWRKNECSMENAFSFARVLPENLDGRRFGFLDEANETLAIIGMSKAQLDACKVGMSYDEKLAEAAAIAAMPGGRDFLYERFDRQFIRDVEFFLKNTRGTGEK